MTDDDFAARAAAQDPPPGFRPMRFYDGFISGNGPLFMAHADDGSVRLGCRIMPHMCNPMGVAHGGWVATLCDVAMGVGTRLDHPELAGNFLLTVTMSVDYLQGPREGSWVEARVRLLRRTKRLVFADALLESEGQPIVRTSGVFRIGPTAPSMDY